MKRVFVRSSQTGRIMGVFLVAACVAGSFILQVPASADRIMTNWVTSPQISHEYMTEQQSEPCIKSIWSIETDPHQQYPDPTESDPHEMCVYRGNGYVYVHFERSYGTYPVIYGESGIAIATGDNISKGILTPVSNFKPNAIIHQSRSKDLLVPITTPSFYGYNIYRFKDFPSQLEYESGTRTYRVLGIVDTLKYKDGSTIGTYGYGISPNGRWLILFDSDRLVRYDLDTNTSIFLAHKDFTVGHTDPSPNMHGFISNDGYVMGAVGRTEAVWVLEANARCIAVAENYNFSENSPGLMVTPCIYRDLRDYVYGFSEPASPQSGGIRIYEHPILSQDTTALTYYDNHVWHRISYQPQPVLQYLALGDSFSSGEGDLNDENYIEGTNIFGDYSANIPRENCHISKNSYPMLLTAGMSFVYTQDSQSVACSGAVIRDIWSEDPSNDASSEYMGQPTNAAAWSLKPRPRLEGITNATQLQLSARSTYIPGRIQQINFVHSIKPAVLTLSIGGNDAGFAPALTACILESIQSSVLTDTAHCHLATAEGKAATAKDISNLYPRLKALYRQLQTASPSTKIYAIGYPTFIDDQASSCGSELIVGSMTHDDRVVVNQFVMYLNAVIKSAAHDANITYIDVTDAIGSSRLCGDGTAVNGVNAIVIKGIMTEYMRDKVHADENIKKYGAILGALHNTADFSFLSKYESERMGQQLAPLFVSPTTALTNRLQEVLHPNAKGHQLMYNQMVAGLGSDLLYSSSCNTIVVCPGGSDVGVPQPSDYIDGVADVSDVVYGRIGHGLGITHGAAGGQIVNDSLQQDQAGGIVLSAETYNELVPNSVSAPVVSIHSVPYELGQMTKEPNGDYRLQIDRLPLSIRAGWHTVHIKGMLSSGKTYDLYHEIFIEGLEGDYDGDGIPDNKDTCAFAAPSGDDANQNGIDDSCDLSIFASSSPNNEAINSTVPAKSYPASEWAIQSNHDDSTASSSVAPRQSPTLIVGDQQDHTEGSIGGTFDLTGREGILSVGVLLLSFLALVYIGKRVSARDK